MCAVPRPDDTIGLMDGHDDRETRLEVPGEGKPSQASLRDGVVYRDAGPWSPAVLALLRHLEAAGFEGAPRVVGTGFAPDGREMLSYIDGSSPQPQPWAEDQVGEIGRLLRDLHDAASTFVPPPDAVWRPWFGRDLPGTRPVFGHCDTGPWNIIARDCRPIALIDFEFAGPVDASWELAQAAWLNAQLHDDDVAERSGLPDAAARARQLRLILDGYGLASRDRAGFVDMMIAFAVHDARAEAVNTAITPDTTSAVTAGGYPAAWAVTWRARSASWMLTHRSLLERAIS
jgi:hypothetical protein